MTTPSMSCPSGGTFWACGDGSKFVGCCGLNPCGTNGCAAGNLATTSFEASQYGQIPDEECSAGLFYTCTAGSTPFWGCCKSNPCGGTGCPSSDLVGAYLSNNPNTANPYLEAYNSTYANGGSSTISSSSAATVTVLSGGSSSASSSKSSLTTSTIGSISSSIQGSTLSTSVSATAASVTETSSTTPVSAAQGSSSSNAGAIAGGVVGGLAVLSFLILGMVFLLRRRNKHESSSATHGQVEVQQTDMPPMTGLAETKLTSPTMSSHPGSPQPPCSPGPPSYTTESNRNAHMSYELSAEQQFEMDSGQMYHPYRSGNESP